jgi:NADH dehydrogenase/NADH:ubiquinone oxidoreductase subunit G
LLEGLSAARVSVGVLTEADTPLSKVLKHVVPGRSILEKSGLLINRKNRMQYTQQVVDFPDGSVPEWRFLAVLAEVCGFKLLPGMPLQMNDRDVTRWYLSADPVMASLGLSIATIKGGGVQVPLTPNSGGSTTTSSATEGAHSAA